MRDLKEIINNSKIWGYEIFMGENSAWIKLLIVEHAVLFGAITKRGGNMYLLVLKNASGSHHGLICVR